MTDNEIINALKCCITNDCAKCKAYDETNDKIVDCLHAICRNALDLINRQKEEIERLEDMLDSAVTSEANAHYCYEDSKSEAIKEFAERLKRQFKIQPHFHTTTVICCAHFKDAIDNLVEEMVGEG
ncbi:MAG: hypothetical protein IJD83_06510 [Clostridia bacterium]|nr:hypothetical protein [Clostridia bacterium]